MTTIPTYVGSAVHIVATVPTNQDAASYDALSWTTQIGHVVDISEIGDQSNDITVTTLAGRTLHANGARDAGEMTLTYVFSATDPGQTILRNAANTNTGVSIRISDPDGQKTYFSGVVANVRDTQRSADAYKGQTSMIRGNTVIVRA